jgi:pimeloyl-ACP methyl ester carboxylesterase
MKRFIGLPLLLISVSVFAQQKEVKTGFIKAGELSIYYESTGKGTPVFLLHAGLQDHTMWNQQVPVLAKSHQVITLDLPTHGKTTGWDTTFLMADILKAVMDSMKIQKASFVGLSFGAVCATDVALKYPERVSKLVLAAPGLLGWDEFVKQDKISKPVLDSLDAVFKGTDTTLLKRH